MTYQLVIQFSGSAAVDFETMIAIEEALIEGLDECSEVDGHDIGSGQFNIFLRTKDPARTFAAVTGIPSIQPFLDRFRVAYRSENGDIFTPIYPNDLACFSVV